MFTGITCIVLFNNNRLNKRFNIMDKRETKEELTARMKMLEAITGSVISSYVNLHYLESLKRYGLVKHKTKNLLNNTIKELQKLEQKEFEQIYGADEKNVHMISSNLIEFFDVVMKDGFTSQMLLQNMVIAYKKDPKSIEGIINKVLNK
jgi:hypothetical protein